MFDDYFVTGLSVLNYSPQLFVDFKFLQVKFHIFYFKKKKFNRKKIIGTRIFIKTKFNYKRGFKLKREKIKNKKQF